MKKAIGVIVIAIFVASGILFFKMQKAPEGQEIAEKEEVVAVKPVEWTGNYIWNAEQSNNSWMCFRKKVELGGKVPENARAQIAADSKYWLYINGEMVVREGELKRGETRDSIYYDDVEIGQYLQEGENTIALLVWYWGRSGFSYSTSGQAAVLFQADVGEETIVTDETWKVSKHEAYLQDEVVPNHRLSEDNVYYDARLFSEDWYQPDYDDAAWANAKVLGKAGDEPWGEMLARDIPFFKDYGLKEYKNKKDYENYMAAGEEMLELTIPYNAQFTPYLKIEAEAGKEIEIQTDQYSDINGDSVRCTYITKDGEQEFESPAWMNGEKVYYTVPAGVKIRSLGYRETGYDAEMAGKFKSDDEFLNNLWKMAGRTLYVNMRDSYMDCPNRERAQWWGDTTTDMMEAMYALDTNSYALYEKGVKTMVNWRYGNILMTVAPTEDGLMHLPCQMLAGINGMYEYYEYTGNRDFVQYVYPFVRNYLDLWQINEITGLAELQAKDFLWEWGDSGGHTDYPALQNAWYILAVERTMQMAEVLGNQPDQEMYEARLQVLKDGFSRLWTAAGYQSPASEEVDERVNALAVLAGLADEEQQQTIANLLASSQESSVYMERYVLEALCEMGQFEQAEGRIKERYAEMVDGENACSTLWESWDPEAGSKNHAWAGGPLIILSKYFAGIQPLEKGYETISIKPDLTRLSKISSKVVTVKGDISLNLKKEDATVYMKIAVPARTLVAVPKISENDQVTVNGKTAYKEGKEKRNRYATWDKEDENYRYFYVEAGEYEIEGK